MLFHIMLGIILQFKIWRKRADNVLKISILIKNVVLLKLAE
jgi:hypothetical protein